MWISKREFDESDPTRGQPDHRGRVDPLSNSSVETSGHLGGPRGTADSCAGPLAANAMAAEPQAADEAAERLPQTVEPVVEQQAAMESWATWSYHWYCHGLW